MGIRWGLGITIDLPFSGRFGVGGICKVSCWLKLVCIALDPFSGIEMDRRTLARLVAERVDGLSVRMASAAIEATCEAIAESLAQGEGVTLSNFGTFKTRQRKARQTYHPRTQEPITIPAARAVAFVPSPKLQEKVRGGVDSDSNAAEADG